MAQTGDIQITSGENVYNYMLIERGGIKAWQYKPVFTKPPDMNKGIINCTILAAARMRQSTNGTVVTDRIIETLLAELNTLQIVTSVNMTLVGHDAGSYSVLMSKTPIDYRAVYDLSGRQEMFEIDLEFIEQHT